MTQIAFFWVTGALCMSYMAIVIPHIVSIYSEMEAMEWHLTQPEDGLYEAKW